MSILPAAAACPPGSWLGVMGGGQLARMFCHAAQALGYRVCVLDPAADAPAGQVADRQIVAAYDDPVALDALAALCAAVSTEFENVPAASLERLALRVPVRPAAAAVAIAQDRAAEKRFASGCGIEVAPYALVGTEADLAAVPAALFPGILKTNRLGYDGKGQIRVDTPAALHAAWARLGGAPCVFEKRLALACEISVIVARGADGACVVFPVNANEHRDGILAVTQVPARLPEALSERARGLARRMAERMDYQGVLCVEMFVLDDGRLVVNEMAPRPHNSGHAGIEALACSQFGQQARVLAGLPLGDPALLAPAVMLNLLGELWFDAAGAARTPPFDRVLAIPGTCLHLYGKSEARPGRKMGHLTVLGASLDQALARARAAAQLLDLPLPACLDAAPSDVRPPRA